MTSTLPILGLLGLLALLAAVVGGIAFNGDGNTE